MAMSTWQGYSKAKLASAPTFQQKAVEARRKVTAKWVNSMIGLTPRGLKSAVSGGRPMERSQRVARSCRITCTTCLGTTRVVS